MNRILFISPHTDDSELACGGTIAKLAEQGKEIYCHSFSNCWEELVEGYDKDTSTYECKNAFKILGVPEENVTVGDMPDKKFPQVRDKIFEELERLKNEILPDTVFIPSSYDNHQDHQTVYNEALRAFRRNYTILGYETEWNMFNNNSRFYVSLNEIHMLKKVDALRCYQSQYDDDKDYFSSLYIFSLARSKGLQIFSEYAETFEIIRYII